MLFQIGFNYPDTNDTKESYELIGAKLVDIGDCLCYEIEIKSIEELEALLLNINRKCFGNDFHYSAVISFGPPTIYLDHKA
jgi:hypothetical protein